MLQVFKYGKKVNISCFMCDKNADFDVHFQSLNGGFVSLNLCESCLNQLKKEFESFEIPDKIKL